MTTFLATIQSGDTFMLDPHDAIVYRKLWDASKPGYIACSDTRDGRRVVFHQTLEVVLCSK
jgi:hypothetical protein